MLDASDLSCRLWPVWHRSARPFTQSTQTCRRHERRCYCMIEKVQLPVLCSVGSNENIMPLSRYGRYGEVLLFSVLSSSQNVLHFGSSEPKRLV